MLSEFNVTKRDRSQLNLIGTYVEVRWTSTNVLSKRQCEKCVYLVRGIAGDMICIELVYDAIDGVHKKDSIYWVNILSVQYLRVLTEAEAQHRIDRLEREALEEMPRD
jgi:hypothetical protein